MVASVTVSCLLPSLGLLTGLAHYFDYHPAVVWDLRTQKPLTR